MPSLVDREPIRNVEAEMNVLGCLLFDPSVIHDVTSILSADDFYQDDHACLYRAILAVIDSGTTLSLPLVIEELRRANRLTEGNDTTAMVRMMESISHQGQAPGNASIVQQKAAVRRAVEACDQIIGHAYTHNYTATEFLAFAERTIFEVGDRRQSHEVVTIGQCAEQSRAGLDERLAGIKPGLATGFVDLDTIIHGLQAGQVIIVAGRPSMGKSALAFNIANHVATDQEFPTLYISLEMSPKEIGDRALCERAEIPGNIFANPGRRLTASDFARLTEVISRYRNSPLHLSADPTLTLDGLTALARRYRAREGIGLLVVDYLQLVEIDDGSRWSPRQEQVAKIIRTLKKLAMLLKIPVIVLSQLNRKSEDREDHLPKMSDLRESGAIEQDADIIMLINRQKDKPGVADLIVAKNRNGGTGEVELQFNGALTRFSNISNRPGSGEAF